MNERSVHIDPKLKVTTDLPSVVASMLYLRNLSLPDISRISGVTMESLQNWLHGNESALREASVKALASASGMIPQGFDTQQIHLWSVMGGKTLPNETEVAFLHLRRYLSGLSLFELLPPKQKNKEAFTLRRYFALSNHGVRILIAVDSPTVYQSAFRLTSKELCLAPGDSKVKRLNVHPHLWEKLQKNMLSLSEFDAMITQEATDVSWPQLALLAQEYGVSRTSLKDFIIRQGQQQAKALQVEVAPAATQTVVKTVAQPRKTNEPRQQRKAVRAAHPDVVESVHTPVSTTPAAVTMLKQQTN